MSLQCQCTILKMSSQLEKVTELLRTRKKKILPSPILRKDSKKDEKKDLGNHCLISLTLVPG